MIKWMLGHYFERTKADLDALVPVEIEQAFTVPLADARGRATKHLRYSGVRDAVFYDPTYNQIVLMEHKTTAGAPQDVERRAEMDTQTAGYLWALKHQRSALRTIDGEALDGAFLGRVAYNVLRKAEPRPPKINQDGSVSVAACTTTAAMYADALNLQTTQRKIPTSVKQSEFLAKLATVTDPFFSRVEYHRTKEEIERWRSDTMVDAARIRAASLDPKQRTRNTGNCNMAWSMPCAYRAICLDDQPELRANFRVSDDPHAEVRAAEEAKVDL
jgi:hypothetical protein